MINRENYLLTREFLRHVQHDLQASERSIHRYENNVNHLLKWLNDKPLQDAPAMRSTFPDYLASLCSNGNGSGITSTTAKKIVQTVKRLFIWGKMAHAEKFCKVMPLWIEQLRPPRKEHMKQRPGREQHEFVTLDEALAIASLPADESDLALIRDIAMACLLFVSGMRVGAASSLPIQALLLAECEVHQWASLGVRTKNYKSATTYLLKIPKLLAVIEHWDRIVRPQLPPTAAWYAPIVSRWGEQTLSAITPGKNRNVAANKRLKALFVRAGLKPKSAHKFRHGHAVYGRQHASTIDDYKAVSQNLMHSDISITDGIYAPQPESEMKSRISGIGHQDDEPATIRSIVKDELDQAFDRFAKRIAK